MGAERADNPITQQQQRIDYCKRQYMPIDEKMISLRSLVDNHPSIQPSVNRIESVDRRNKQQSKLWRLYFKLRMK